MNVKLPRTVAEFITPEGKAAVDAAEKFINAMSTFQLTVIDANGASHTGVLEFSKEGQAVMRLKL